jgi:hypothetical protein
MFYDNTHVFSHLAAPASLRTEFARTNTAQSRLMEIMAYVVALAATLAGAWYHNPAAFF